MELLGRIERPIEFVAVGHLAVDVRLGRRVLGGSAAYSCLAAYRLGLSAAMVTAVGDDFDLFGPLEGIEIHYHRNGLSTSFENVYEGAARHQRLLGRAKPLSRDDLAVLGPRLAEDSIVLYCPIAMEVQTTLQRLTSRGLCGVAPQGFFRRWDGDGSVLAAPWNDAPEQLEAVDFLSTSVTDPPKPEVFRQTVVGKVPILALTEAEQGARIFIDGRAFRVPAFRREPVEPTGAGDVFAASFLVALREGNEPLEAAEFACCAASFAVEREGVDGMPPSRDAVLERLSLYRKRFKPSEITS